MLVYQIKKMHVCPVLIVPELPELLVMPALLRVIITHVV